MIQLRRFSVVAATSIALVSCTSWKQQPSPREVHVVIAGTTDLHGWVSGHDETLANGEYLRSGGLDILGGYVRTLRSETPGHMLLVDSGDMFQGTLESNLFEGESVVRAYNTLGYTAAAVGNHEFDFGPRGPEPVVRHQGEDPLGALKHNVAMAKYPFLSANTYDKETGQRPAWLKPWILASLSDAKIGIIGVTTVSTPVVTTPSNVKSLEFRDPVPEIIRGASELRAAGADAIIVLAHIGGSCTNTDNPRDLTSCRQDMEILPLARSLPPGIVDVIFAGHTHAKMRQIVNGTPVIQAAALGRGLAVVDLSIDPTRHKARVTLRPLVDLCAAVFAGTQRCTPTSAEDGHHITPATFEGTRVDSDPVVASVLRPFSEQVAQKKREPLGIQVEGAFTGNYQRESTLGNLIAGALLHVFPNADFAIVNSGGLRADLQPGEATFGAMFSVLPFDNSLAVLHLSGAEFRELMRLGTTGRQGILQIAGARVVIDPHQPEEKRIVSITRTDGSPIDDNATYIIVASDFLATGGDGLVPLTSRLRHEQIEIMPDRRFRDAIIDQLRRESASAPLRPILDDRLHFVNDPS